MTSTPTQDSAFLRLPLEIRHEIYSYLIHLKNTRTLSMDETCDPASGLGPVTRLLGVSQQIRTEVHGLVHAVTTLEIKSCKPTCFTIEPHHVASKTHKKFFKKAFSDREWFCKLCQARKRGDIKVLRDARAELSKDEEQVPYQFKCWKVRIPVWVRYRFSWKLRYIADVDFRAKAVRVHSSSSSKSSNNTDSHPWYPERDAFINAMRFFAEQDGFSGITIADISLFLQKVVVELDQGTSS
ncbi:hypothetical protein KCU67_g10514, partial [Aureobasidium melanogenum]